MNLMSIIGLLSQMQANPSQDPSNELRAPVAPGPTSAPVPQGPEPPAAQPGFMDRVMPMLPLIGQMIQNPMERYALISQGKDPNAAYANRTKPIIDAVMRREEKAAEQAAKDAEARKRSQVLMQGVSGLNRLIAEDKLDEAVEYMEQLGSTGMISEQGTKLLGGMIERARVKSDASKAASAFADGIAALDRVGGDPRAILADRELVERLQRYYPGGAHAFITQIAPKYHVGADRVVTEPSPITGLPPFVSQEFKKPEGETRVKLQEDSAKDLRMAGVDIKGRPFVDQYSEDELKAAADAREARDKAKRLETQKALADAIAAGRENEPFKPHELKQYVDPKTLAHPGRLTAKEAAERVANGTLVQITSPQALDDVRNLRSLRPELDEMENLVKKVYTAAPGMGWAQALKLATDRNVLSKTDAVRLEAFRVRIQQWTTKAVQGSRPSDYDAKQIEKILPSDWNTSDAAVALIGDLKFWSQNVENSKLGLPMVQRRPTQPEVPRSSKGLVLPPRGR